MFDIGETPEGVLLKPERCEPSFTMRGILDLLKFNAPWAVTAFAQ
jgi:hypothetical protein